MWGTDEVAWTTLKNGEKTTAAHKGIFLNSSESKRTESGKCRIICGMTPSSGIKVGRGRRAVCHTANEVISPGILMNCAKMYQLAASMKSVRVADKAELTAS